MNRTLADLDPAIARGVTEIKLSVARAMGDRFRGLLLYGSQARGDAEEFSDIDLMVLLEPPVNWGRDWDTIHAVAYPVQLDRRLPPVSIHPVAIDVFNRQEFEIYRAVKEEGIVL